MNVKTCIAFMDKINFNKRFFSSMSKDRSIIIARNKAFILVWKMSFSIVFYEFLDIYIYKEKIKETTAGYSDKFDYAWNDT